MNNREEVEIAIIRLESELAKQRKKFASPVPLSISSSEISNDESEELGVLVALTLALREFKKIFLKNSDQH